MGTELFSAAGFLRRQFPAGAKVLCAVSGGLDSMCLLHFACRQKGLRVVAAHFNHGLRGEAADADEAFVRTYCEEKRIPFFAGRGDTRALAESEGMSAEEAGRELRYAFLQEVAAMEGCNAILTAHHADDNAETMLLNLIRGTGSAGLAGIPQVRGHICRPFLRIARETLAAYAAEWKIPHVEDETNADSDAADRNRIRLEVMPLLKKINPRAAEHMSHASRILLAENAALEAMAEELLGDMAASGESISLSRNVLLDAPLAVAERMTLQMLAAAAGQRKDLTAAHVEAVLELADAGADGSEVSLPYGLVARREGEMLQIRRKKQLDSVQLCVDTPLLWGDYTVTLMRSGAGEGMALTGTVQTIAVGPCPAGERIKLQGENGARTIKRLCMDRKIPLSRREGLPAIYADGHLAGVWSVGVDETYLPTDENNWFIRITERIKEKHHE